MGPAIGPLYVQHDSVCDYGHHEGGCYVEKLSMLVTTFVGFKFCVAFR